MTSNNRDGSGLSSDRQKKMFLDLLRGSSVYGLSRFVIQFGSLLFIPIYLAALEPAENGILAYTSAIVAILPPFLTLSLGMSAERFYYEYEEKERKRMLGALWLTSTLLGLAVTLVIDFTLRDPLEKLFPNVDYDPYLRLALWTTYLRSLMTHPTYIMRASERAKLYGIVSILNFASTLAMVLVGVVVWQQGVLGVLGAQFLSALIWAFYWVGWMLTQTTLNLHLSAFSREIRYALPTLPTVVMNKVSLYFDRMIFGQHITLDQMGIYHVASRFGQYFTSFNSALKTAFRPMIYKRAGKDMERLREELPSLSVFYFFIITCAGLASSLLLKEVIIIFGKDAYLESYQYVPAFIGIAVILNFSSAFAKGADIVKRPVFDMIPLILSIIVRLGLLAYLIPRYGIPGALVALFIAAVFQNVLAVPLAHYLFPRPFLWGRVSLLIVSTLIFFFIGSSIDTGNLWVDVVAKTLVCLVYGAASLFVVDREIAASFFTKLTSVRAKLSR